MSNPSRTPHNLHLPHIRLAREHYHKTAFTKKLSEPFLRQYSVFSNNNRSLSALKPLFSINRNSAQRQKRGGGKDSLSLSLLFLLFLNFLSHGQIFCEYCCALCLLGPREGSTIWGGWSPNMDSIGLLHLAFGCRTTNKGEIMDSRARSAVATFPVVSGATY